MTMSNVFADIDAGLERALDELIAYCRLPTVSAHGTAIEETAQATIALLRAGGFETRLLQKPSGGFPVVYAEQSGRSSKTLLFYNHYDVQPADPLDEWTSPPFEPARRDG